MGFLLIVIISALVIWYGLLPALDDFARILYHDEEENFEDEEAEVIARIQEVDDWMIARHNQSRDQLDMHRL
jgi:hypothetical protein